MPAFVAYYEDRGQEVDYPIFAPDKAKAEEQAKHIADDQELKLLRVEED